MLYENQILDMLEQKGFERNKIVQNLDANKHNHGTTCYYLILKKLEREGKIEKLTQFNGQNFLNNVLAKSSLNDLNENKNTQANDDKSNIQSDQSLQHTILLENQYMS